jgi:hypothetical protein
MFYVSCDFLTFELCINRTFGFRLLPNTKLTLQYIYKFTYLPESFRGTTVMGTGWLLMKGLSLGLSPTSQFNCIGMFYLLS